MKMYLLDYGYTNVDKGIVLTLGQDIGKVVPTPIWGALLDTGKKYVLIDTGMNPIHIKDPNATFIGTDLHGKIVPVMNERNTAIECVKACGVSPNSIKYVINTHLHFDHCGGNLFFPNARFVVQKHHYNWATSPKSNCPKRDFLLEGTKWLFVDGDVEFLPKISLILTPGHVPYHQSILIDLGEKKVIIAGDAVSLRESMSDNAPITADNPVDFYASIRKLQSLSRKYQAQLLLSHDQEQWSSLIHAPKQFQ